MISNDFSDFVIGDACMLARDTAGLEAASSIADREATCDFSCLRLRRSFR
jgi:hypothetical protein